MSVVAISSRPHRPDRPDRTTLSRPRPAPTLTITLEIPAGALTPGLARLVDLLGELAETGEGMLRHQTPGRALAGRSRAAIRSPRRHSPTCRPIRRPYRPIRTRYGSWPAPGSSATVRGTSR